MSMDKKLNKEVLMRTSMSSFSVFSNCPNYNCSFSAVISYSMPTLLTLFQSQLVFRERFNRYIKTTQTTRRHRHSNKTRQERTQAVQRNRRQESISTITQQEQITHTDIAVQQHKATKHSNAEQQ